MILTPRQSVILAAFLAVVMVCSIAYGTIKGRQERMSTQIGTACVIYRGGPEVCE